MMKKVFFIGRALRLPVFLCILFLVGVSASFGYQPAPKDIPMIPQFQSEGVKKNWHAEIIGEDYISKILYTLETRNYDWKVIRKAEEKLRMLDEEKLRLMSSLSDRISANGASPGATIALSLITAMIVLS